MPADVAANEPRSEKLGIAATPTEMKALAFIQQTHGDRYEGVSSVLRDYSLSEAVGFYLRAKSQLGLAK